MIEQNTTYRPRVPHETRRLLIAVLAALLSIWALARIRFPDQSASSNPVGPLLSQLTPRLRFEDLATQIASIRPRLDAAVYSVGHSGLTAVRVREGVALALAPSDLPRTPGGAGERFDRPSGLVAIETDGSVSASSVSLWPPAGLDQPRYLIAALAGSSGLRLIPILTAALEPVSTPVWPGSIWAVSSDKDLPPGALLFTEDAQFVGGVWLASGRPTVVPAATLIAEADRILATGTPSIGWLGVDVAPLTPALARATGAHTGVVVAWIDPRGPAASTLRIGDVVESINGEATTSTLHWRAREGRLAVGQPLALRVRRAENIRDITVTATATPPAFRRAELGLDLRPVRPGSEVLRVSADSVSHAAGLRPGDVIVHVGETPAPSPAQVRRVFAASAAGQSLLIAITREGIHHVLTLEKDAPEQP